MNHIRRLFLIITIFIAFSAIASESSKYPVSADEAFVFSADFEDGAIVHFDILKGYYLYLSKFKVHDKQGSVVEFEVLGNSEVMTDDYFGEVQVIDGNADIVIANDSGRSYEELSIFYQGCKEGELCYPPESKTLLIDYKDESVGWR